MKKLIFPVIIIALAYTVLQSCKRTHEVQNIATEKTHANQAMLNRGRYMATLMCGQCHFDQSTGKFSGAQMMDVPKVLGFVYAANITNDPVHGIANYTDGELLYLLRTGIKKNGKVAPFMQRPNLADEDLNAIIAYLRSNDPAVQPAALTSGQPKNKYSFIGKMAIEGSKPLPYTAQKVAMPNMNDKVARGRYMIDNIGCYDCHSANIMKVNKVQPEASKGYLGGGTKMRSMDGSSVYTSNITFDAETGIGNWTEADFAKAVRQGIAKNNQILRYPMRMYSELSDEDVSAMYEYLKTVPAIKNKVKGSGPDKSKKKD